MISPLLGLVLGALIMMLVSWIFFRSSPHRVDKLFRRAQLVSSALYSLGHGSNDAQKTMGIIWMLLIAAGVTTPDHLPLWVIVSCYMAIALGTLFGGWRIVKTMGQKITKLRPVGGFSAETGGALTLLPRLDAWAFRCRRHTPSPARSLAWGRLSAPRRVRWGARSGISCWRGSSRSPASG